MMNNLFKRTITPFIPNSKTETQRKQKRVSFDRKPSFIVIPNSQDLQQCGGLWIEKTDTNSLDQEMRDIIKFCSEGTPKQQIEKLGFCARGLETRLRQNMIVAKRRQREAKDAVFDEISVQNMDRVVNMRRIARKYSAASKTSVEEALRIAKEDEREAKQIYH